MPDQQQAKTVLKQFRIIFGAVKQHFRKIEATCGISGSQLWLLNEIAMYPELGISKLAERLAIHQSTCSLLVEKLVKKREGLQNWLDYYENKQARHPEMMLTTKVSPLAFI